MPVAKVTGASFAGSAFHPALSGKLVDTGSPLVERA